MSALGGPLVTESSLTQVTTRFRGKHAREGSSGWHTVRIKALGNLPITVWMDNSYDGGGWICVMANRGSTGGMNNLTYSNAVNTVNYRTGGSNNGSNTVTHPKRNFGLGDFNAWVGLKYWKYLAGRKTSGKITIVQFVSTSARALNDTSNHTKRAEWAFSSFDESTWAMQTISYTTTHVGDSPGFYGYHAGRALTTYDSDNDSHGGNCSTYYNNNPWFYGACWSGNYFAGGGYADRPYWNSSGGDNHAYGAVYIK